MPSLTACLANSPGEQQTHGGLDLSAGDGGPAVVVSHTGSFRGNTLEHVIDEGVHDAHGLAGNSKVGVNLLQHLVNVDAITFPPPPPLALLVSTTGGLCLAGGLLRSFTRCGFGRHVHRMKHKLRIGMK